METAERINTIAVPQELPTLSGFEIIEMIGEGAFSQVFRAKENLTGQFYAVKVSRQVAVSGYSCATGYFATKALMPITGSFTQAKPLPADLLRKQYMRFLGVECDGWLPVKEIREETGTCNVVMEYDRCSTLRDLIQGGAAAKDAGLKIAAAMSKIMDIEEVGYHGDLKPENILVSNGNPRLIDPGYFGLAETQGHNQVEMKVTTWQYYPWLVPDDMFALGIILLELSASIHPFLAEGIEPAPSRIGPKLLKKIEEAAMAGNSFARNIQMIPAFVCSFDTLIPRHMRTIALKCMGMQELGDGQLEVSDSYNSFGELYRDLAGTLG